MKANQLKCYKIWTISVSAGVLICLLVLGGLTVYVDPLFHYHAPLGQFQYELNDERYQNDGIVKHFDYNAIITGTSMTENFKASECDALFGVNTVKVAYAGGSFKIINENLERAFEANPDIKLVLRCLDYNYLGMDKDYVDSFEYPAYLYNYNLFDDVNYFWNKDIFLNNTIETIKRPKIMSLFNPFDDYANWNDLFEYGKDVVLATYTLGEQRAEVKLDEGLKNKIIENLQQNVVELVLEHPETEFYFFFPPYSISYWDSLCRDGQINQRIDAEQIAIEQLLQYPNVKLFDFSTNFGMVCDLNNYKDMMHYGEWVNSWMLQWMASDQYLLTEDNYMIYINNIRKFYTAYDYESLHK